ncbi:MAG: flagellar hook-length control protein FliK [Candidatus Tectimicrobiota bacterium]
MVETIGPLTRVGTATPIHTPAHTPSFSVGEQHVGAVVRVLPHGGVLAELNGQHLILEPGQALAPGDRFVATVAEVSPTLVLQLTRSDLGASVPAPGLTSSLPGASPASHTATGNVLTPGQLKAYLAASQPLGQTFVALEHLVTQHPFLQELDAPLLQALRDTLGLLHPQDDRVPDATQLREQVQRSGLNYEKTVEHAVQGDPRASAAVSQDVKGQLLALAQRLEPLAREGTGAQAREAAETLTQITRALDNIEFQQVVNQLAPTEHQPVVVPVLLPGTPTAQPMSLAVQREGHAGPGAPEAPERYTLVLQLDLTGLGPLRIAATVHGSQIATTFQVQAPDTAALVQDAAPALVASLRALGFQSSVACEVQPHLPVDTGLLIPRAFRRSLHAVDVTI